MVEDNLTDVSLLEEELRLLHLRFYGHPEYFERRRREIEERRSADVMTSIRRCAAVTRPDWQLAIASAKSLEQHIDEMLWRGPVEFPPGFWDNYDLPSGNVTETIGARPRRDAVPHTTLDREDD